MSLCVTGPHCVYSSADGRWGCFHVLATVSLCVQVVCGHESLALVGTCPRLALCSHDGNAVSGWDGRRLVFMDPCCELGVRASFPEEGWTLPERTVGWDGQGLACEPGQ